MKPFLAALALGTAIVGSAPASANAAAVAPADANLDRLVALIAPEEAIRRLAGKAFDAGMDQQIAADPKMKAAFDANPDLRAQVGGQLRSQFTGILVAALPSLRAELNGILQAQLTASEIADTLTFFSSATGKKLRAQVYESMGSAPGQSAEQVQQAAMAAVMAKMTPDDYPALLAFAGSPASQKMRIVNPQIQAASTAWAQKLVEANRPKMEGLAIRLTADYLAKKGGK